MSIMQCPTCDNQVDTDTNLEHLENCKELNNMIREEIKAANPGEVQDVPLEELECPRQHGTAEVELKISNGEPY